MSGHRAHYKGVKRPSEIRTNNLVKNKSDTAEIIRLTAAKLGKKVSEVEHEIRFFWLDIDQMFTWNCGYGMYVEKFGHFLIYTNGVSSTAIEIEKRINNMLRRIKFYTENNLPTRKEKTIMLVQELLSRLILLNYSVEAYKRDVLGAYPRKYKIGHEKSYNAVFTRLGKRLGISLAEFPITISNPIQKVFVQKLRTQGVLHNPVIDTIKGRYKVLKVQQVRVPDQG